MFWMKIKYRLRYYRKAFLECIGICPKCYSRLAGRSRVGTPICTKCFK